MRTNCFHSVAVLSLLICFCISAVGCEAVARKHDPRVGDIEPPPPGEYRTQEEPVEFANFPDLIEGMLETREQYISQMITLERAYLDTGDSVKANWARQQRELTEAIEVYPYLTAAPPEHRAVVSPQEQIPEADAIYREALALLDEVRGIPLMGKLEHNQRKVRQALDLFRQVLRDYPNSDKVDDCAFYCGEIYKEYLRDDDPDNELAIRYYKWAVALDPETPHAARFQCAVVYEFRRHDRAKALELYNQVLETEEAGNMSNMRFAADRIAALGDDDASPMRPILADGTEEPGLSELGDHPAGPEMTASGDVNGDNTPEPDIDR